MLLRNFVRLFSRVDSITPYYSTFYKIMLMHVELAGYEIQNTTSASR